MIKAISLLSGGLDSILATRIIMEQSIEVEAVTFVSVFSDRSHAGNGACEAKKAAAHLGIRHTIIDMDCDFLSVVKNPAHGYGKNANPCIDCRILTFKLAHALMQERGASFMLTGEVLGERPMSQRKDALRIIDRESNTRGLVLRPLSAQLLEPTNAEKEGLVDRSLLYSICGRSRKGQLALAQKFGITDFPNPAGGCLLTDKNFSARLKDLMLHNPDFSVEDAELLKRGRHFRLSEKTKIVLGRDEKENNQLEALAAAGDVILDTLNAPGPRALCRGACDSDVIEHCARIVASYSDAPENGKIKIATRRKDGLSPQEMEVSACGRDCLEALRI